MSLTHTSRETRASPSVDSSVIQSGQVAQANPLAIASLTIGHSCHRSRTISTGALVHECTNRVDRSFAPSMRIQELLISNKRAAASIGPADLPRRLENGKIIRRTLTAP